MGYNVTCGFCKEEKDVPITAEQYIRLHAGRAMGMLVQDVVPDLERKWREMFISGMCPDCWEKFFGPAPIETGPAVCDGV